MATKASKTLTAKSSKKKTSKKKKGTDRKRQPICFTIMPFGGWFNDYYLNIYRPAIEAAGMKPHRADDLYRPSTIVNDIWAYTKQSKIVLADLTGKNPNVFYELGLAHALAKPAILVAESMDDVPFDLRSLRVIEYDKNDPDWGKTLQEKIENAVREVLNAPLQAVLPGFLDVKRSKEETTVSEHEKELLDLRQEIESIRADVRSRTPYERPDRPIASDEALELVKHYLGIGVPREVIVSRLAARGAPRGWVERRIDELNSPSELSVKREPIHRRASNKLKKQMGSPRAKSSKTTKTGAIKIPKSKSRRVRRRAS
jgi:hypothetical protein